MTFKQIQSLAAKLGHRVTKVSVGGGPLRYHVEADYPGGRSVTLDFLYDVEGELRDIAMAHLGIDPFDDCGWNEIF